jgi:hypothetical protein
MSSGIRAGEAGETWIETPTDGQVALENVYYYNEDERTYITVSTLDPPSAVLLEAASYDSANYRTWIFPSQIVGSLPPAA